MIVRNEYNICLLGGFYYLPVFFQVDIDDPVSSSDLKAGMAKPFNMNCHPSTENRVLVLHYKFSVPEKLEIAGALRHLMSR
jgi:hypothetical protein